MADVKIRVIGEDKASSELAKVDKSLATVGNTADKQAAALASIGKAIGGIGGVAASMKVIFDIGQQGAAVKQTADSFDLLIKKVGGSADMMDQLRAASKGTVSDMTLMSATATLLAGTSGEMGKAMADAAPQILEIAKAANKLNPSLGDTEFLYSSLMTGIKRGSPMLIDNTGITLKLGQANEDMAKKLGKTVEQLTAEEQKMAILNATLEAGATMLDQVGGNTDSATDAIARMDSSIKNLTDSIKAGLSPTITEAANSLNTLLTASAQFNKAWQDHAATVAQTTKTYSEYEAEVKRIVDAQAGMRLKGNDLYKLEFTGLGWTEKLVQANYKLSESEWRNVQVKQAAEQEMKRYATGTKEVTDAVGMSDKALKTYGQRLQATADAYKKAADEAAKAKEKLRTDVIFAGLEAGISGTLKNAREEYTRTLEDLSNANDDLSKDNSRTQREINDLVQKYHELQGTVPKSKEDAQRLSDSMRDTQQRIQDLSGRLGENTDKMNANDEARKAALDTMRETIALMIYQQASEGLSADAALVLARNLGVLSEEDYKVAASIQSLKNNFDANHDGMIDNKEGAMDFTQAVTALYNATMQQNSAMVGVSANQLKQAGIYGDAATAFQETADNSSDYEEQLKDMQSTSEIAAKGTQDLAKAIIAIPTGVTVDIQIPGLADLIRQVDELSGKLNGLNSGTGNGSLAAQNRQQSSYNNMYPTGAYTYNRSNPSPVGTPGRL